MAQKEEEVMVPLVVDCGVEEIVVVHQGCRVRLSLRRFEVPGGSGFLLSELEALLGLPRTGGKLVTREGGS